MRDAPPPRRRPAAALLAAVALLAAPAVPVGAAVHPGSIVQRAEGSAPVIGGRVDTAFGQALDEAFRRALLAALRVAAPDRQSARDLETWQETVLARVADFVGAWRVLAHEERGGFVRVEAEVEIWRDKLARAARSTPAGTPPPAVRLLVLGDPLPVADPASGEEFDAGRIAASSIEAEFARRGAVILATANRSPWVRAGGPGSEENRVALAAAEGKRLNADAVVIVRLSRLAGGRLAVAVELVAAASEATLASARAEAGPQGGSEPGDSFAPAARQIAAALAPRLGAARADRARP